MEFIDEEMAGSLKIVFRIENDIKEPCFKRNGKYKTRIRLQRNPINVNCRCNKTTTQKCYER